MLDFLQWPAMVITVVAAYLVASRSARKRKVGFWVFLTSNVAWIVWGLHAHAYALIVLQVALAALNIRGVYKNEKVSETENATSKTESEPTREPATGSSSQPQSA
jgi:hypothetical protein